MLLTHQEASKRTFVFSPDLALHIICFFKFLKVALWHQDENVNRLSNKFHYTIINVG